MTKNHSTATLGDALNFLAALQFGKEEKAQRLLAEKPGIMDQSGARKESILHMAIAAADKPTVLFLIKNGADVMACDYKGNTPLHYLVWMRRPRFPETDLSLKDICEIGEALLSAGADVNARNNNGNTPLHYASNEKQPEIISFLLEKNADPTAVNKLNRKPLDLVNLLPNDGSMPDERTVIKTYNILNEGEQEWVVKMAQALAFEKTQKQHKQNISELDRILKSKRPRP